LCDGQGTWEIADAMNEDSLEQKAEQILALLKTYKPVVIEFMDPSLHYLPPHVPKVSYTALGDLVAARERSTSGNVPGDRWISLRLDGSGFSRTVRVMRQKGILKQEGFSETFASCMQLSLRALMEHFNALIGYTQSDEMIVFVPPTNVIRGEQQPHMRNGRVTKLTTLAASFVTAHFIMQLAKNCNGDTNVLDELAAILPHFDCRLGHYASWNEARALLMWRAYDCSVNGVSDAVYHTKVSGKEIQGKNKVDKVKWLHEHSLLPLPRHQAYGTVLVRVKRTREGQNPLLGTTTTTVRSAIEQVDGPVLELLRRDALIPPGGELENFS